MQEILHGQSFNKRSLFAGGEKSPGNHDDIEFITISTLGNAADFGDLDSIES